MIDAGSRRPELLDDLRDVADHAKLSALILSHADEDHIGGAINLLLDETIKIDAVFVPADSTKRTRSWHDLSVAIDDAVSKRRLVKFRPSANTGDNPDLHREGEAVQVRILAPPPGDAMSGPGGIATNGDPLDTNSAGIVVEVGEPDRSLALFTADIDAPALERLLAANALRPTELLVYPHHGASPGERSDPKAFARTLAHATTPKHVVFSLSREKTFSYPKVADAFRAATAGLLEAQPDARLICTQLTKPCCPRDPAGPPPHHLKPSSDGHDKNHCCMGTMIVSFAENTTTFDPPLEDHAKFVRTHSSALCQIQQPATRPAARAAPTGSS